jgi:preprotein translocase subunit SecF
MDLKKYQYHFFILPAVLVALSLAAVGLWGLKPNVELAGGSLLQVHYEADRPAIEEVESTIAELNLGEVLVQPSGDSDYMLRQRVLTPEEKTALLGKLSSFGTVEEMRYTSIGPSVGSELVRKAWWAIGLVILSTILYIAFAFRGVGGSKGNNVPSWKYGLVAILTLAHDVIIPVGLYAYLGYAYGSEVGTLFIVALLTILGISINDTIVIFDRIRENLAINENDNRQERYADVVWRSITQTLARSVNTSLTVIMMLLALVFLGPESTRELAITLTVGMIAGTYSSIFLAAPMLVVLEKYQKIKPKKA